MYIEDIEKENFIVEKHASKKTWELFVSLREQYYEKIKEPPKSYPKTTMNDFVFAMRHYMSGRLYLRLKNRSCYLEDLDEYRFFQINGAGHKTFEEFNRLKEKYYEKINKKHDCMKNGGKI